MSKFGIIFCAYNCAETIEKCLEPWKKVKNENFVYSCVSAPFKGYEDLEIPKDKTLELVSESKIMDLHFTSEEYLEEIKARGFCLEALKKENCDWVWMVDADECYTVDEINNIIKYVEKNSETAWFKISLKNFIFDEQTYLSAPFCPARIYRVSAAPFILSKFYQDNDISYFYHEKEISNSCLKNKIIPTNVANPIHLTWLNNEKTKLKISYQQKRWGGCSYRWNQEKNCLEFDPEYFQKNKLPIPEVVKIN